MGSIDEVSTQRDVAVALSAVSGSPVRRKVPQPLASSSLVSPHA